MSTRERVVTAIEARVIEAEKLLAEAVDADEHARLSILITGWCRGIAGALEEIAVELDEQRRERHEP
ncbi:MAG TPA: hypothetical protein VFB25_09750 [Gaiellaceae bacterium]|nr:hypothetical protein [Gaiellaceae bacterium]